MSEPEITLPQTVADAIQRETKWTEQHSWIPKHGIDDAEISVPAETETTTDPSTVSATTSAPENTNHRDAPVDAAGT